ncbi:MAG: formylglycine-generating enzyme family protein [Oligoflexales bacterium]
MCCSDELLKKFVKIKSGSFIMGRCSQYEGHENSRPTQKIFVDEFYMSQHAVTASEYKQCVDAKGCEYLGPEMPGFIYWLRSLIKPDYETYNKKGKENFPINYVTWSQAKQYVAWRSEKEQRAYRLCYEKEWEYVARSGFETRWPFGDDISYLKDYAWYAANNQDAPGPKEVMTKKPNPWGIYDLNGNIVEMLADPYKLYSECAEGDEKTPTTRGGGYGSHWTGTTAFARGTVGAERRIADVGFRLCANKDSFL